MQRLVADCTAHRKISFGSVASIQLLAGEFRLSSNFDRPRHLTARAKSALADMTGCDRYSATPNLLGTQAREPFSDDEAHRAHRVHAPAARPGDNATARNARAA